MCLRRWLSAIFFKISAEIHFLQVNNQKNSNQKEKIFALKIFKNLEIVSENPGFTFNNASITVSLHGYDILDFHSIGVFVQLFTDGFYFVFQARNDFVTSVIIVHNSSSIIERDIQTIQKRTGQFSN